MQGIHDGIELMTGTAEIMTELRLPGAVQAFATATGHALLNELGLASLDDILGHRGGEVVIAGGRRSVRRLETRSGLVYLKLAHRDAARPSSWAFWKAGARASSSGLEARHYQVLDELGIEHPEVLAWGERIGLFGEGRSFLLTRALSGVDLEAYLLESRSLQELKDLSSALALVVARLARGGQLFADLVSKHIHVEDDDGRLRIRLLDLHRLSPAATETAALQMILGLDAELPRSLVSSGRRLAFLHRLEAELGLDLQSSFRELRRRDQPRRRSRRRQAMSRSAMRVRWTCPDGGALFVRDEDQSVVRELNLGAASSTAELDIVAERAERRDLELHRGDHEEIREIIHGHHYLEGLMRLPRILAKRLDRDGLAFVLRERSDGFLPLRDRLRSSLELEPFIRGDLEQALRLVIEGGFAPRMPLLEALRLSDDGRLVFVPGATTEREPSAAELLDRLAREIAALGKEEGEVRAFVDSLRLERPGLLGRAGSSVRSA